MEDSKGNKVFKNATQTDKFGVASAEFKLADEVNLGTYHLRALMDENNAEADLDRPLTRRTELTVDDNIAFGPRVIPLSARVLRDVYADGGGAWIGQLRGSASH